MYMYTTRRRDVTIHNKAKHVSVGNASSLNLEKIEFGKWNTAEWNWLVPISATVTGIENGYQYFLALIGKIQMFSIESIDTFNPQAVMQVGYFRLCLETFSPKNELRSRNEYTFFNWSNCWTAERRLEFSQKLEVLVRSLIFDFLCLDATFMIYDLWVFLWPPKFLYVQSSFDLICIEKCSILLKISGEKIAMESIYFWWTLSFRNFLLF